MKQSALMLSLAQRRKLTNMLPECARKKIKIFPKYLANKSSVMQQWMKTRKSNKDIGHATCTQWLLGIPGRHRETLCKDTPFFPPASAGGKKKGSMHISSMKKDDSDWTRVCSQVCELHSAVLRWHNWLQSRWCHVTSHVEDFTTSRGGEENLKTSTFVCASFRTQRLIQAMGETQRKIWEQWATSWLTWIELFLI